jgi:predicted dehydrogenase
MKLAIVGCGFVADYYLATAKLHPELVILGVHDRIAERADALGAAYGLPVYPTLEDVCKDARVEMVLNLTNPRSHYEVSKAALLAGKHVYSEKPLAMAMTEATELVEIAERSGLRLASAPCSVLGEAAQAVLKALRDKAVGTVRVVYAEMDDGMVHRMNYRSWKSVSGVPWPYQDEFEIGCTLEHAGYYLTWLVAMFGPAESVTSFASVQVPDKVPGETLSMVSPDFSVACILFRSGVVARLTCGILAPHDHVMKVVGDDAVLYVADSWDYRSPVYLRRWITLRRKTFLSPWRDRRALARAPHGAIRTKGSQSMDFCRGPAEVADALKAGRPSRLSASFALHVTELALAIHDAPRHGSTHRLVTDVEPIEPMPWAA